MYYVIEYQTRPDGIVNATVTGRSSLALGLALYFQRAAVAVTTTDFVKVALTLQDQYGDTKMNQCFDTLYQPTETNE